MKLSYVRLAPALALVGAAVVFAGAAEAATAKKAAATSSTEAYQRATAESLGNMAWESVKVADIKSDNPEPRPLSWMVDTPSGKWACTAKAGPQNAYCERPAAPAK